MKKYHQTIHRRRAAAKRGIGVSETERRNAIMSQAPDGFEIPETKGHSETLFGKAEENGKPHKIYPSRAREVFGGVAPQRQRDDGG